MAKNTAHSLPRRSKSTLSTRRPFDFGAKSNVSMMVDGVMLLVDASRPLPQPDLWLRKPWSRSSPPSSWVNKSDRSGRQAAGGCHRDLRPVHRSGCREEQISFPILYAVSKEGVAKRSLEEQLHGFCAPL